MIYVCTNLFHLQMYVLFSGDYFVLLLFRYYQL
jgi:hypothetical protein